MKDVIAEPYRTKLLPGFNEARQAVCRYWRYFCGISGSGQRCLPCAIKPRRRSAWPDWLGQHYLQNQEGFVHICRLDTAGARNSGITDETLRLRSQ